MHSFSFTSKFVIVSTRQMLPASCTRVIVSMAQFLHLYAYSSPFHGTQWKLTQYRKPAGDRAGAQDTHLHPLHPLILFLKTKSELHVATSSADFVLKPEMTVLHAYYCAQKHKGLLILDSPGHISVFCSSCLLWTWSAIPSFSKLSLILVVELLLLQFFSCLVFSQVFLVLLPCFSSEELVLPRILLFSFLI